MNEATRHFIRTHRTEDVRALALQANRSEEVDITFALNQIQGWQTAQAKLPSWAALEEIIYPPHLNMEQCSSEATARYKAALVMANATTGTAQPLTLVDLTGASGWISHGWRGAANGHGTWSATRICAKWRSKTSTRWGCST